MCSSKSQPVLTVMRILITGGAGFLGSHLSKRLLKEGHEVICMDNFFTGRKHNILDLLENSNFETEIFDIIFLDPPFRYKEIKNLIDQIKKIRIANFNTLLIIHRNKKSVDKISQFLNVLEEKNYGLSKIFFCKLN